MRRVQSIFTILMVLSVSCSSESNNGGTDSDAGNDAQTDLGGDGATTISGYTRCASADRIGGFELALADGFSTVQGQVEDGVNPNAILNVTDEANGCEFLTPPQLLCDPVCEGGQTCAANGGCVPLPSNQDVGTVTITGLSAPVMMDARAPVNIYSFTDDLPHPAFSSESKINLSTSGFELSTSGVDALETTLESVALVSGEGAAVNWTAGPMNDDVKIEIELNIANHGGTPGRIECQVDDTGSFTIPAALVDALVANGFSGFPSLRITRLGASTADTTNGCVDLKTKSEIVLPVEIPGLVSCSDPEDCPDGETCRGDLTCG